MSYMAVRGFNYLGSDDRCEPGETVDADRFTSAQLKRLVARGVIRKASAIETKSEQKKLAGTPKSAKK